MGGWERERRMGILVNTEKDSRIQWHLRLVQQVQYIHVHVLLHAHDL